MNETEPRHSIGEVVRRTGLSADTLRYYERLGLLHPVRTAAGSRRYGRQDLSRLGFIRRAKAMNFSLGEIADLLAMRDDPRHARTRVRQLTQSKLEAIEHQLEQLDTLRRELTLLLNLCHDSDDGCPIIEDMNRPLPPDAPDAAD